MKSFLSAVLLLVSFTVNAATQNDSLSIRLSAYEIDLGEKAGRAVIDTAVWVKNVSNKRLRYFNARTSCDCIKVLAPELVYINPGDSLRFPIRYDIRRYYAAHEYIKDIRLDFSDGIKQYIKVSFYIEHKDANKDD